MNFFRLKSGETPTFDLVLLGIGEDGHTASPFPGTSPGIPEEIAREIRKYPLAKKSKFIL